jgi:autotransporter-associated beta strand protein
MKREEFNMVFSWWRKLVKDMSNASPSRRRPARAPRTYRLRLEALEDRLAPATSITVIPGASGSGSQDSAFLASSGQLLFAAPDAGPNTLSTGAMASIGANNNIVVDANQTIAFNDVGGALALQTGPGHSTSFSTSIAGGGAISFTNTANTVSTAGGSLTFAAGTNLTVANLNSGGGAIALTGSTSLTSAVNINAGAGTLSITAPTVTITAMATLTAAGTTFTINTGGSGGTVAGVIAGAGNSLTKNGTGSLTLSSTNTYGGTTTVIGGTLSISADANLGTAPAAATPGSLTLNGGTLTATASFTLNANRGLGLGAGGGTVDVSGGTTLTVAGIAAGTGSLTKTDSGTLVLSNASNSYSGGTVINAGTLSVAADGDLGVATGSVTINDGATLFATATCTLGASRTVILGGGSDMIEVAGGGFPSLTVAGQIIGTGTLTTGIPAPSGGMGGVGELVLANATNSYSGGTTIGDGGFLVVGADGELGAAAGALTFDLDLSATVPGEGFLETTASFTTSRAVTLSDGIGYFDVATGTLTVGGQISGNGELGVDGTLKLTGNNTYTGSTNVFGTLLVNGSQPGSDVLDGNLGGIGRVGDVVLLSGKPHLAPGSPPPGILTTGNLALSENASFDVSIQGTTAGSGYSQLNVQGTVGLDGQLSVSTSVVPPAGSSFTIIKNNGASPVFGTFTGLLEGAVFSVSGPAGPVSFQITYHGGSGRDVVLLTPSSSTTTGTASYVVALYRDLLQRQPDGGGLTFFTDLLNAGTPRTTVLLGIETSVEYRTLVIQNLYQTLLHRAPDPVGFNIFLQFFASGGTLVQAQAFVFGSPEYFTLAGSTSSGFITALYRDVLSRHPDPSGMATFSQFLASGGTRLLAAQIMLNSLEADQDVVQGIYLHFLRRAADPAGLTTWTNFLQQGATDEQVLVDILASDEYFGR